jgi:nucleoside-diphosphate-sugar epimerase
MKILITGNMGYVGPKVVSELRRTRPEATLVGADLGFFAHCLTADGDFPERQLDAQVFADVRRLPREVLDGVDAVVHLAAISNDPIGSAFEEATLAVNHEATVSVARLAKEAGVRSFVFASSCSMYGYAEEGLRTEESELAPLTAYARSKVMAERDLKTLASASFTVTSLRFATACGMSERLRLDLVLNDFVAGAIASRKVTLLSDGTPWRPLINVSDMARAIDWAVDREGEKEHFLALNAGSDEWNYQVRDLAEAVAAAIPGVELSIPEEAAPDRRSYRVSFAKFRELAPSHQPQVDLATTIADLRRGLEALGFADENFRASPLIRLHVLNEHRRQGRLSEDLSWARSPNGRLARG